MFKEKLVDKSIILVTSKLAILELLAYSEIIGEKIFQRIKLR